MGVLYKLTSPSNKSYIGISIKTTECRWAKHVEHAIGKRDAGALYGALRKYRPESFKVETLATEDEWQVLCQMERLAILEHNTLSPNGYNMTDGGEMCRHVISDRSRQRISDAQKKRFQRPDQRAALYENLKKAQEAHRKKWDGKPRWKKTQKPHLSKEEHSRRTKEGMARPEVKAKVLSCAKDRAASPEWRRKQFEARKARDGRPLPPCTEERKRKISEARKREWADPIIRARRLAGFKNARDKKGE